MGTFSHPITLVGPTGASETLEALIDAKTLFAVFPRSVLEALGVRPTRTLPTRVAGVEGTRQLAQLEVELDGNRAHIVCVFGAENEPARLGTNSLDSFLVECDPDNKALVPKVFRSIQHI